MYTLSIYLEPLTEESFSEEFYIESRDLPTQSTIAEALRNHEINHPKGWLCEDFIQVLGNCCFPTVNSTSYIYNNGESIARVTLKQNNDILFSQ